MVTQLGWEPLQARRVKIRLRLLFKIQHNLVAIIFACVYLYITVVIFIDYSDIDKMMDINNEKC